MLLFFKFIPLGICHRRGANAAQRAGDTTKMSQISMRLVFFPARAGDTSKWQMFLAQGSILPRERGRYSNSELIDLSVDEISARTEKLSFKHPKHVVAMRSDEKKSWNLSGFVLTPEEYSARIES